MPLPIRSLYRYVADVVTILYPLETKLFVVYAFTSDQHCLLFMPIGTKCILVYFKSFYQGMSIGKHKKKQFFAMRSLYFQTSFFLNVKNWVKTAHCTIL